MKFLALLCVVFLLSVAAQAQKRRWRYQIGIPKGLKSSMKILMILAFVLWGHALSAQGLSEQKLIELKKAGVESALIVKQIEKDGISFQMDADATIRLKQLGFSQDVLNALLSVGDKKTSGVAEDPVRTLYSRGKYPELCDYLKAQLEKNPTNYRLRTILIGALLKINQQPAALGELEKLKNQSQDPTSKSYLDRASLLLSSWQKQEEGKNRLLTALQNYNYNEANSATDQLPASVMQKTILHMLIDSYAGKFDLTLSSASPSQGMSFAALQQMDAIKQKLAESEKEFEASMRDADVYLHGPLVPSSCGSPPRVQYPDFQNISIRQYGGFVTKLTRLAPLNDDVMDMAFHLALLSTKYEDLEALGDKILAAKGSIRIAFYSRDRFFNLIVDVKKKRIYTQPDPHPFVVRYFWDGWSVKQNASHNNWDADVVPFDLAFGDIRGLTQNARGRTGAGGRLIVSKSYALAFEPLGVAPNYALMNFIFCTEGEEAELQATRNLGQFILHVIGNPSLKAELADPTKAGHGGNSGFGDAIVAMYGATHGNTPMGAMAMQMAVDNKAQNAMAAQEQQATWQSMLSSDYSSLLDGSVFDGLDKIVEAP
jgi:hypothetical protein